jgi:F0F1-type ATP synthase membrane subunit b/b'
MATISSISGGLSANVSDSLQFRLQQARRDAEQAEAVARSLQAKAGEAQRSASEAVENARMMAARSAQAQTNAEQARGAVTAVKVIGEGQAAVAVTVDRVTEALKNAGPVALVPGSESPVKNMQGQLTGTVVNITA